jgi:hypothetical protein
VPSSQIKSATGDSSIVAGPVVPGILGMVTPTWVCGPGSVIAAFWHTLLG